MAHLDTTIQCDLVGHDMEPCEGDGVATTYVVWRWLDQGGYFAEHLCDTDFAAIKASAEQGSIVLVWAQSMDYLFNLEAVAA